MLAAFARIRIRRTEITTQHLQDADTESNLVRSAAAHSCLARTERVQDDLYHTDIGVNAMPAAIVYQATNRVNGKRYIGITTKTLAKRMMGHYCKSRQSPTKCRRSKFHNAINKYGMDAFDFVVIESCGSFDDAKAAEQRYIFEMRPEYNLTKGGDGVLGIVFDDATRMRMRLAKLGKPSARQNYRHSPEVLAKIAATKASRPPVRPWLGKKRDLATIAKIRATKAGKPLSEKARKGNEGRWRPIICMEDGEAFPSAAHAAKHYGLCKSLIYRHCQSGAERPYKTKLTFRYVDEVYET